MRVYTHKQYGPKICTHTCTTVYLYACMNIWVYTHSLCMYVYEHTCVYSQEVRSQNLYTRVYMYYDEHT